MKTGRVGGVCSRRLSRERTEALSPIGKRCVRNRCSGVGSLHSGCFCRVNGQVTSPMGMAVHMPRGEKLRGRILLGCQSLAVTYANRVPMRQVRESTGI